MNEYFFLSPENIETCKHPLLNTESFYSPDRRSRIFTADDLTPIQKTPPDYKESYCAFCLGRMFEATPEKNRTVRVHNKIKTIEYPPLNDPHKEVLFRRQGNLFEILSFPYWRHKYGLDSPPSDIERINDYFNTPNLREYIEDLLRIKLFRMKIDSDLLSLERKKDAVKPFFSGFHELLTSGRHFLPGAVNKSGLFASSTMSWQDHRVSYHQLCNIHIHMRKTNPYISFIATFQNWHLQAGASFEHWHKQILGLDFWGRPLENEAYLFKTEPYIYRDFALGTAIAHNLFIAENEHAIAYIEVGGKVGLITICSKSKNLFPSDHLPEEIDAMSDLVHAVYSTLGVSTPCNEEWFYTPFNSNGFKTPWRIILNLRSAVLAGFENISQILVNPISQIELAYALRIKMAESMTNGHLAPGIHIAPMYKNPENILAYH